MLRAETPTDALTGRPLYFVPSDNLPPMPAAGEDYDRAIANFHHPVHQRRRFEAMGLAGEAARDSGLQWTPSPDHVRFHMEFDGLNEHMPTTNGELYEMAAIGDAGYVPRQAIDFSGPTPRVANLSRSKHERLRTSGEIIMGRGGARMRHFYLEHAFDTGAGNIDPRLVSKFMDLASRPDTKIRRQHDMARYILQDAVDATISTRLRDIYEYAKGNQMLRPGVPSSIAKLIRDEVMLGTASPEEFISTILDKCITLGLGLEPVRAERSRRGSLVVALQT